MISPRARVGIATLCLSAAGLVGLVGYEGYTDRAVIPIPGDVPTIGFGTTEGVKLGDKTTPPKALSRALTDIQKYEGAVKRCVKVPLTQGEYDSFISASYNIGGEAFCNSTLVKKLNAGDYDAVPAQLGKWVFNDGKPMAGLVNRRASEAGLWAKGAHVASRTVPAAPAKPWWQRLIDSLLAALTKGRTS